MLREGSREQGAGRRGGWVWGRSPRSWGMRGRMGEAGEGVLGPGSPFLTPLAVIYLEPLANVDFLWSRNQGAWRRARGGGGRSPGTRVPGGGLGEAGEGVPGPRDLGPGGGVGEAGEGVPGPGGREEGRGR